MKTQLLKHPLALSDTQVHIPLLPDKCRQRLAIPDFTNQAEVPWSLPKSSMDLRNRSADVDARSAPPPKS